MVLETLLFVGGLAVTVGVGTPVAVYLAQPHRWRSSPERDPTPQRRRLEISTAFTPLDLGPDPVRWPSERAWATSPIADPQWPSLSWEDEHFGSHWRKHEHKPPADGGFHTLAASGAHDETPRRAPSRPAVERPPSRPMPAPSAAEVESQRASAIEQRRRQQQSATAEAARQKQQQIALEQARRNAAARAAQSAAPASKPAPAPAPANPTAATAAPASSRASAEPMSRAEVEDLMARVGLAGTVQAIMDRTGWDFRQAAQHLARVRQQR